MNYQKLIRNLQPDHNNKIRRIFVFHWKQIAQSFIIK